MKKNMLYLLIFSLLYSMVQAQVKEVELTHYLLHEFTKGIVLMKNGEKKETILNYNSLTEEMIFENRGVKLAMTQLDQIDTVYIDGRKFFLMNNKFLELLYHSKIDLYAEHKCDLKDPGKPAGYGGTSQTSAITTYSSYLSGSQAYDMKLPESYETKPYTFYWLKKDGELNKFISMRQLMKLFGDKEILFKGYTKKNSVKIDNPEDIIGLVKFLDGNY